MPRKTAKRRKLNKKVKAQMQRVAILTLLFVSAVSFLGGLAVYKAITRPFASAQGSSSFDIINSDLSSLLIITVDNLDSEHVKTTALDFIVYDKQKNKVVSFDIPLNWETDIPGRFGSEEFSKVVSIGMLDTNSLEDGAELVRKTLEKNVGFNVDRYIMVDENISDSMVNLLKNGKSGGIFSFEVLTQLAFSVETDMDMNEFYDLYSFVTGLPTDRFISHKESSKFFETYDYTDTLLRDVTFDSAVALEKASVAILNGTNISDIADFGSRVIKNVGGYVVAVDNAKETYHGSILVVDTLDSSAVSEIQRFFEIENVILKDDYHGNEHVVPRADITLILGFDIANTL